MTFVIRVTNFSLNLLVMTGERALTGTVVLVISSGFQEISMSWQFFDQIDGEDGRSWGLKGLMTTPSVCSATIHYN